MAKIRVGIIYGGRSGEHEVSLKTAMSVINEMDFTKYDVIPFYISKQGEWKSGPKLTEPIKQLQLMTLEQEAYSSPLSALITNEAIGQSPLDHRQPSKRPLDVVIPLLHGTYGEDGTIQGLLEIADIPYVGAGVLASAVGMDKVMMKKVFQQEGLPQCVFRYFTGNQWNKDQAFFIMEIEVSLGYPCFVKPANLGSSVGISKVHNREELIHAITYALKFDRKVIVEESVLGREIEVSVLGNDDPQASVPGEIVSSNEFYDYRAKYTDGKSTMIIPADLSEETTQEIRDLAIRAFQAIDGSGLSRVDFFLTSDDEKLLINEINTMPGFTPFSMYPLLWKHSGKPYDELIDDLIALALERHQQKQLLQYSFDE